MSAASNGPWPDTEKKLGALRANTLPAPAQNDVEYAQQYERLRQQALLPDPLTNTLELTFIECRGLAAWMASQSGYTAEIARPLLDQKQPKASARDQVQILTDLVLGKREEQGHD